MLVHKFIDGKKPIMVLLHGLLTPWQIWMPQICAFKDLYNIYAIALNAHTEEAASEFLSVSAEAEEITAFFVNNGIDTIDVLCGLSLGGKIAYEIWKNGRLHISNLVMDGAPLAPCPKFAIKIMEKNYKDIILHSKKRNKKVIASLPSFLPEKCWNSYLKIADLFSDRSIENIVHTVFAGGKIESIENHGRILFIHGTKPNEILSRLSAGLLKKHHPATQVVCFRGDAHCQKVIFQPEKWTAVLRNFLENQ